MASSVTSALLAPRELESQPTAYMAANTMQEEERILLLLFFFFEYRPLG
jgi:hypothetical protein